MKSCMLLWQISKSKCTNQRVFRALLEAEMLNKCTRLWPEARLEAKMHKKTSCLERFLKLRCGKSACRCGAKHISKSEVLKTAHVRTTFGRSDVVWRGRPKGLCA